MSEVLANGIELPDQWPPRTESPATLEPMRVPYLDTPPAVIPIDLGRQLFVDDFLIAHTTMPRRFHQPVKHPGNPVFYPCTRHERNAELPPCTIPKCGGIWYDPEVGLFKMWYMASYLGYMAYATSTDGIYWERPALDVVPGTNLILPESIHPDSGTVWFDPDAGDPAQRYKMLVREPNTDAADIPALMFVSADGIHWSDPVKTGRMHDRSTMFYNPFRRKWVQSIRAGIAPRHRCRLYWEHDDFITSGQWRDDEPVFWTGADCMDESGEAPPQLYNLDAVAYESLMVGFYQILKGPPNECGMLLGQPKLTELTLATSRDGFHWHRPCRRPFIGARREPGSWEFGYVESTGGILLTVGDDLWFYYSAYAGDYTRLSPDWHVNGMYANGAVGLAKLRRDGFASLQARIPDASVTTRPVRFSGDRLFVNVNTAGTDLRVACVSVDGKPVAGLQAGDCVPYCGNATCVELKWRDAAALGRVAGQPMRFRFQMDRGDLYAFWVTSDPQGDSGGFRGAGGPFTPLIRVSYPRANGRGEGSPRS